MTLPTPWTIIEVYGQSLDKIGNPNSGTIAFVMLQPLVVDGIEVTTANLVATLDETGSFSIELPATDDPNVKPQGAAYMVYEQYATGLARPPYAIPVTYTAPGGRLNLFEIAPLVPAPPTYSNQGPPGNTLFAVFDIDPSTGELSVTTPVGYLGPSFSINASGYLGVNIA